MKHKCMYLISLTHGRYCDEERFGDTNFCETHQPNRLPAISEVCQKDVSWHEQERTETRSALLAELKAKVEEVRINQHIHHGSYVQGNNKAVDVFLAIIEEVGK